MKAQELKNSILKHAMEGKLIPQNTNDEPVEELLFRIEKEINNSIKDIKSTSDLTNNSSYDIPKSWRWIKLDQLIYKIQYGYTASAQKSGNVKLLRITDIQNNQVNWNDVPYCDVPENRKSSYTLDENDIVIARTGGTIGKSYIIEEINHTAVFASYLIRIKPVKAINVNFLKKFLDSPLYWSQLKAMTAGTGQPNVNATNLKKLLIPLPPLEEQERILEKIEELIQKVDQYDLLEQKLSELNDSFPVKMEKSVLQYAMEGKLVEQQSHDKAIDLAPEKTVHLVSDELTSYDLPASWTTAKLGDLLKVSSGKNLTKKNMIDQGEYNVYGGNGIVGRYNQYNTEADTLIIGRVGYYCGSVHLTKSKSWVTDNAFKVTFNKEYFNLEWLYYLLISLDLRNFSSSTAQPVISGKRIYPIVIGIPPLDEQKRIVEKINEILNNVQKLRLV